MAVVYRQRDDTLAVREFEGYTHIFILQYQSVDLGTICDYIGNLLSEIHIGCFIKGINVSKIPINPVTIINVRWQLCFYGINELTNHILP